MFRAFIKKQDTICMIFKATETKKNVLIEMCLHLAATMQHTAP
jgi:hypothetical protein